MKQKYRLKMGSEIHAHRRQTTFERGVNSWQTLRSAKACMYLADEFLHTANDIRLRVAFQRGLVDYMFTTTEIRDLKIILRDRVYISLFNHPHSEYDGFLVDIVLLEKYV